MAFASRYFSTLAIIGVFAGVFLSAWLRFSGRTGDWHTLVVAIAFLAAGLIFLRPLTDRLEVTSTVAGLTVGGAAGALWVPCTGSAFGSLLNDLPTSGAVGAVQFAFYVLAVLSPLIVVGALFYVLPDSMQERIEQGLAMFGAAVLVVISFTVVFGIHESVIGRLVSWSVPS